ncbi:MAG: hypothetical protein HQL96_04705 [Magnetococcales bacterium]|nr:hypothetical protein [Magnetococcales bacterium]
MQDLNEQIAFVVSAVPRLLRQMDHDPLSPTWGSAHLAYWRDKTSELSDMRRQEAMLPLALLYTRDYPGSSWRDDPRLLEAVEALLRFWCDHQYPDGSMDEWYKGERAFAASAFSCHAVARTLHLLEGRLAPASRQRAREKLAATARWLTGRDDLFKTNHQAVGVAALAWAGAVLDDAAFTRNAREKLHAIIRVQTPEGWFPEVGHMDVGYTFLTVEFVAMAMALWQDWSASAPFVRAFDFACEWVHPDLTIGEEYGVCHNPYLSRIAILLMADRSGRAAGLAERLQRESVGFQGFTNTLGDDLRLPRWAFQPLLAHDYRHAMGTERAPVEVIPLAVTDGGSRVRFFPGAGLARFVSGQGSGVFAPVAGGLLRLFAPGCGGVVTDCGYAIALERGGYATNLTYDRKLAGVVEEGNRMRVACPMPRVRKFMPSLAARLVLRLACSTRIGSRLARRGIDWIRRRKGSALNQSSANLGGRKAAWQLERELRVETGEIRTVDRLVFAWPVATGRILFVTSAGGEGWPRTSPLTEHVSGLPERLTGLVLEKIYRLGAEGWHMTHLVVRPGAAAEG